MSESPKRVDWRIELDSVNDEPEKPEFPSWSIFGYGRTGVRYYVYVEFIDGKEMWTGCVDEPFSPAVELWAGSMDHCFHLVDDFDLWVSKKIAGDTE